VSAASLLAVDQVEGPIRFPGAPSGWAIVLLALATVLFVRWVYRRERQQVSVPARVLLVGLRVLAIALVALALFRPEREVARVAKDRSHLVVLVDTSSSMSTVDRYHPDDERKVLEAAFPQGGDDGRPPRLLLSREEIVARTLAGHAEPVLRALAEKFVLHVYAFDEDLRLVGSTEPRSVEVGAEAATARPSDPASIGEAVRALAAEGRQTAIGAALKGIAREFVGRDDRLLAGVVVISDGRDNAEGERPLDALAALGKGAEDLRVAAVALGDPRLAKNLKVDRVIAPDVVLVQDTVTFLAELRHVGFEGVEGVSVALEIDRVAGADGRPFEKKKRLREEDLGPAWSTRVRLLPPNDATPAVTKAPFNEPGTYDVTVRATLPRGLGAEDAVLEDDVKVHRLRVVDSTIKVLVVDREMRYETHFLKNVLVRDVRSGRNATRRVDAQVWIQSFDPEVRQSSSKTVPPLKAFPTTRQELFSYDVIVFGDVAWRRLAPTEAKSAEVLKILREFVAEGGGIAFVAGETANPTQYLDTPLNELMPVVVRSEDRSSPLGKTAAFRVEPTDPVGASHPILSVLQDSPAKVRETWRDHEGWEWYWLYRARGGLKPGATALGRVGGRPSAEFLDERGEPYVVFATMGYGKGKVFFSAIDQVSRIRMSVGDKFYGAFWDEAIRWLATYRLLGGNKRYKIETDKESYFVGETAVIKVSARDADYKPLAAPVLRGLQVEGPDGKPLLEPEAAKRDPEGGEGLYRAALRLPSTGTYRIYVDPPERDGGARAEHRIEARFATREDQDKVPDHDTLLAVVRATNPASATPRLWKPWELPGLVDAFQHRTTERVLDRRDEPLWDNAWPLILATLVLAIEWILRKRFQMI
jgi:hypothetical protein